MGDWGQFPHFPASSDWDEFLYPDLTAEDHRLIDEAFERIVHKNIITRANRKNDQETTIETDGWVSEASEDRD